MRLSPPNRLNCTQDGARIELRDSAAYGMISLSSRHGAVLIKSTEATREEMSAAKLPMAYRDSCAHLLIPLNRCRNETYFLPWKCEVRLLGFPAPAAILLPCSGN